MLAAAKGWARRIKRDVIALYLAARDPRTPWYARVAAAAVAAYALSPIDLIPDVVPVLGYLDDLLIVPLGILLVIRLIPAAVLEEHRATGARLATRPVSYAAAALMVGIWLVAAVALFRWLEPHVAGWLG
ncbi:YkvA family protein [Azospirillum himalayense]|uniref:YkvA family protein n=1 Tax=Azospirillum himalayense TaxID=654847 RepID=A0ABW0G8I3_9PROT